MISKLKLLVAILFYSSASLAQNSVPECSQFLSRVNDAIRESQSGQLGGILQYDSISRCSDREILTTVSGGRREMKWYRFAILQKRFECNLSAEQCYGRSFQYPLLLTDAAEVEVPSFNYEEINFLNINLPVRSIFGLWGQTNYPGFHLSTALPFDISASQVYGTTTGSIRDSESNDPRPGGLYRVVYKRPLTHPERAYDIPRELFPSAERGGEYFEGFTNNYGGCDGAGIPWRPGRCLYAATRYNFIETLAAFELPTEPTPTPTSGPNITPSATPTVTPTPTATPQDCLSEAQADPLIADIIRGVTASCPTGEALFNAQNEIKKVEAKRCEADKRKGLLHGLARARSDKGAHPYDAPYTQNHTNQCDTGFLNVALFGRYNFQGNPPQKEDLDTYLEANGWTCHDADTVTPYKFLTVLNNVALVVKKSVGNNKAGAYVVDHANDEAMVKFLEAHGKYNEFMKRLKTIKPKQKRDEIVFGVADASSPNQFASFLNSLTTYRHGETLKHTKVCLPPAENVVKDERDDSCFKPPFDKSCTEQLGQLISLRKAYPSPRMKVPTQNAVQARRYYAIYEQNIRNVGKSTASASHPANDWHKEYLDRVDESTRRFLAAKPRYVGSSKFWMLAYQLDAAVRGGYNRSNLVTWIAILIAENGGDPWAVNVHNSGDYSVGPQVNFKSGVHRNNWAINNCKLNGISPIPQKIINMNSNGRWPEPVIKEWERVYKPVLDSIFDPYCAANVSSEMNKKGTKFGDWKGKATASRKAIASKIVEWYFDN